MIIALEHYACNYNASTLYTGGLIFQAYYVLLFHISKPNLVQVGLSMPVANHTQVHEHTCVRMVVRAI